MVAAALLVAMALANASTMSVTADAVEQEDAVHGPWRQAPAPPAAAACPAARCPPPTAHRHHRLRATALGSHRHRRLQPAMAGLFSNTRPRPTGDEEHNSWALLIDAGSTGRPTTAARSRCRDGRRHVFYGCHRCRRV